MNVFDNLAFPLVCRNWDKDKIRERVGEVAEILGISDKLGRAAIKLGIDEKQLVSLGRGLVRDDVSVLLMDEPLTVIDPQLKFLLRKRIKEANDELGSTIIYVTHDQYEAMTFAEELLVMSAGEVIQKGSPETLFERPVNNYVGYFIGSPAMNFLDASVSGGKVSVEGTAVATAGSGYAEGSVKIGILPEYVRLAPRGGKGVKVTIDSVLDQGNTRVVTCRWGSQSIKVKLPREVSVPSSGEVSIELPTDKTLVYAGGNLVQA
jgi:glycerol transport system ATP-binding protein